MIILKRFDYGDKQTLGYLTVFPDKAEAGVINDMTPLATLELPWEDNQQSISCIPEGTYDIEPYHSPKFGDVLLLKGVPNRKWIEIHSGNYHTQIEGCILVGYDLRYINNDDLLDTYDSKNALNRLLKEVTEPTKIEII